MLSSGTPYDSYPDGVSDSKLCFICVINLCLLLICNSIVDNTVDENFLCYNSYLTVAMNNDMWVVELLQENPPVLTVPLANQSQTVFWP